MYKSWPITSNRSFRGLTTLAVELVLPRISRSEQIIDATVVAIWYFCFVEKGRHELFRRKYRVLFFGSFKISISTRRLTVIEWHLRWYGAFCILSICPFVSTGLSSWTAQNLCSVWRWTYRNSIFVEHRILGYAFNVFLERSEVSFLRHHVLTEESVVDRLRILFEQVIISTSERGVFNLLLCCNVDVWVSTPLFVETWTFIVVAIVVWLGGLGLITLVISLRMLLAFGLSRHLEYC
jgi:hypothetical protein